MDITRRTALAGPAALAGASVLPTPSAASTADLVAQAEHAAAEFMAALSALARGTGAEGWHMNMGASWGPERHLVRPGWGGGGLVTYPEAEPFRGRRFFSEAHVAEIALRDGALGLRWA